MRVTDEMVEAAYSAWQDAVRADRSMGNREAIRDALEAALALSHAAGQEVVEGLSESDKDVALAQAVEFAEYVERQAKGAMVDTVKRFLSLPYSQEIAERIATPATSAEVERLRKAAARVNKLYPLHWDRVDGAAVVMPERVAEFEEAFAELGAAMAASSAQQGAVARSEGEG